MRQRVNILAWSDDEILFGYRISFESVYKQVTMKILPCCRMDVLRTSREEGGAESPDLSQECVQRKSSSRYERQLNNRS